MSELTNLEGLKKLKLPLCSKDGQNDLSAFVRDLRTEALQWIREFQTERTNAISEMFDNVDKDGIYPTTIFFNRIDNFWKTKFNIIVEDLKNAP